MILFWASIYGTPERKFRKGKLLISAAFPRYLSHKSLCITVDSNTIVILWKAFLKHRALQESKKCLLKYLPKKCKKNVRE